MRSPFVRVVDAAQRNVLFVLEQAVEGGVVLVELELGENELDVGANERAVAYQSARARSDLDGIRCSCNARTASGVTADCSCARLEPRGLILCLLERLRITKSMFSDGRLHRQQAILTIE